MRACGLNTPVGLMKLVHKIVSSQSKIMTVSYIFGFYDGVNQILLYVSLDKKFLLIYSLDFLLFEICNFCSISLVVFC